MKTLIVLFAFCLYAAETPKVIPVEPTPLTPAQSLELREAQVVVLQALLNKNEADRVYQDAQSTFQAKITALQKELHCDGCSLSKDLKWVKPVTPK